MRVPNALSFILDKDVRFDFKWTPPLPAFIVMGQHGFIVQTIEAQIKDDLVDARLLADSLGT